MTWEPADTEIPLCTCGSPPELHFDVESHNRWVERFVEDARARYPKGEMPVKIAAKLGGLLRERDARPRYP